MHVGHMACHVSTCMAHGEGYKYCVGVVCRSREQQVGKGREKKKGKKGKIEWKRKGERMKEKRKQVFR